MQRACHGFESSKNAVFPLLRRFRVEFLHAAAGGRVFAA
jgi:hypothetical protein